MSNKWQLIFGISGVVLSGFGLDVAVAKSTSVAKPHSQCQQLLHLFCPPQTMICFGANESMMARMAFGCDQELVIADQLQAAPHTLSLVQAKGPVSIIRQYFPADGQSHYYAYTNETGLVNLTVVPSDIQASDQQTWLPVASGQPIIHEHHQRWQVTAPVSFRKNCLACQTVAKGVVHVKFNQKGQIIEQTIDYIAQQPSQ